MEKQSCQSGGGETDRLVRLAMGIFFSRNFLTKGESAISRFERSLGEGVALAENEEQELVREFSSIVRTLAAEMTRSLLIPMVETQLREWSNQIMPAIQQLDKEVGRLASRIQELDRVAADSAEAIKKTVAESDIGAGMARITEATDQLSRATKSVGAIVAEVVSVLREGQDQLEETTTELIRRLPNVTVELDKASAAVRSCIQAVGNVERVLRQFESTSTQLTNEMHALHDSHKGSQELVRKRLDGVDSLLSNLGGGLRAQANQIDGLYRQMDALAAASENQRLQVTELLRQVSGGLETVSTDLVGFRSAASAGQSALLADLKAFATTLSDAQKQHLDMAANEIKVHLVRSAVIITTILIGAAALIWFKP